jgi:hypothetical protein
MLAGHVAERVRFVDGVQVEENGKEAARSNLNPQHLTIAHSAIGEVINATEDGII